MALATAGLLVVTLACMKSPEQKKREKEQAQEKAADEAKTKAELEARFRKECKVKDGGVIFPIYDDDLVAQCHAHIDAQLKVPGSSDFPSSDSKPHMVSDDGCNRIFESTVDAQNAYGVKVRTHYSCTYDPRTSLISVKSE